MKKIPIESDDDRNNLMNDKAEINNTPGNEQVDAREDENQNSAEASATDSSDVATLKALLAEKEAELLKATKAAREYLDHAQRLKAEFENYKRRTIKEKADTIKYANEDLFRSMLSAMDNLRRGCAYATQSAQDEEILKGIRMVERQFFDTFGEYGVKSYESVGQPFDPYRHESLYCIERDDVEPNTVIQEVEPGYTIHDKILRAAKVAVSKAPEDMGCCKCSEQDEAE